MAKDKIEQLAEDLMSLTPQESEKLAVVIKAKMMPEVEKQKALFSGDFEKEGVVMKLTEMKNASTDNSMQTRIDETISKVISEKYDKLTYFKLKNLKEIL